MLGILGTRILNQQSIIAIVQSGSYPRINFDEVVCEASLEEENEELTRRTDLQQDCILVFVVQRKPRFLRARSQMRIRVDIEIAYCFVTNCETMCASLA